MARVAWTPETIAKWEKTKERGETSAESIANIPRGALPAIGRTTVHNIQVGATDKNY
jgi:hypothetical protein